MIKSISIWIFNKLFGNMPKRIVIAFSIMVSSILILIFILIFRKPAPIPNKIDTEKSHRDTITLLLKQKTDLDSNISRLSRKNDSLVYFSGFIRTYYKEKKIYVYEQNINQLDSVVRSIW